MKKERINLGITLALTIVHNLLFWDEYIGINMLIFSILMIVGLAVSEWGKPKSLNFWVVFLGSLVTGFLVVVHNSTLSKVIHVLSLIILVGFIHFPRLKSLLFAFGASLEGVFSFPKQLQQIWFGYRNNSNWIFQFGHRIRLVVVPLLILTIFYWIFVLANPRFSDLSNSFWEVINNYFLTFFEGISFMRIFMIFIAFFLIGAAIFLNTSELFFSLEKSYQDRLLRSKLHIPFKNSLSLINEYKSAVLTVGMVNILLILVNILDIQWIWFDFDKSTVKNLSQFVHEGTYLLIGSILLSVGIILYFFRANLNFYKHNLLLKNLTYLWIFQNIILCISVALRNYRYIESYGLAYKRIGVVIFLIITIIGLFSLLVKVNKTLSSFYLWRINAWNVYLVMGICCFFNWDILITRYNLEIHKGDVDLEFLFSLSNKTAPLLIKHREVFQNVERGQYSSNGRFIDYNTLLKLKIKELDFLIEKCSWKSWNYADYMAYKEVKALEK